MIKIEMDEWAGVEFGRDDDGVSVEATRDGRVAVYAPTGQTLWSWLVAVRGFDGDEASEIAGDAYEV